MGYAAGYYVTTGANNALFGANAGYNLTGTNNTILGAGAGTNMTDSGNNVIIGHNAGYGATPITTGSANVMVGVSTDVSAATGNYQIALGYNVTCTGNENFTFGNNTTDSNIAAGATTITAPSDVRLKEEIEDEKVGLNFINELRPVTFRWKKPTKFLPK